MNLMLSRHLAGLSLRSWNTTAIFYCERASGARPISINMGLFVRWSAIFSFGWLVLGPTVAQAQNEFLKHSVDAEFLGVHALQTHDLDGDGDMDIIGAGLTVDKVSWWENDLGNGLAWIEHVVSDTSSGARFVDAADIDADGDLDLFGAAASVDRVSWWENTNGQATEWVEHIVDADFNFAMHLHSADLDADGDLDLMGAALKDDAIHWWENVDGSGLVWTERVIKEEFDGARHVCSVDLDGDGDLDLLGSAYLADDVMWWENTLGDASTWEPHVVDEDFDGVNVVMPVDIDGDNDIDLLGAADVADDVVIWFNTAGDGLTWERLSIDENFDGAFSAYPADMDGDGDIDVLGAATQANSMVWWENTNGLGNSWNDHPIDEEFDAPMAISATDFDGDGDLDVLGGSFNGQVAWWETDPASLPVELTAFDAIVNKDEVVLQWETASELNNAGFEVQHKPGDTRIAGATAWEVLAFVKGAGTDPSSNQYQQRFTDLMPGTHRFRLKQIDFDGDFDYSAVVEVVIKTAGQTMSALYPNPFNPAAQFYLTVGASQRVNIDVYNALGQKVASLYDGVLAGNELHQFNFQADNLPGGLYLINATGESFSTTQRAMLVK